MNWEFGIDWILQPDSLTAYATRHRPNVSGELRPSNGPKSVLYPMIGATQSGLVTYSITTQTLTDLFVVLIVIVVMNYYDLLTIYMMVKHAVVLSTS
jgi:hypothetical protein